jgi:hypothetical protein
MIVQDRAELRAIQRFDQSFLHLRLRHSLGEQDDLSETLASSFIDGSSSRSGSPAPSAAENVRIIPSLDLCSFSFRLYLISNSS